MNKANNASLIDLLLRIEYQLQTDSKRSLESLQRRDRKIGLKSQQLKHKPLKQLSFWLQEIGKDVANDQSQLTGKLKTISSALFIIGLIIGAIAGFSLFYYVGDHPINVINVLLIGVGLQLLFLIFLFISLLPIKLSIFKHLQEFLFNFNAAIWFNKLLSISSSVKGILTKLYGLNNNNNTSPIFKLSCLYWSQLFALGFNIMLILSCLYLVSFSDLAFGWSTTLKIQGETLKSVTDLIALPWKSFLPLISADLDLINSTRFFRLNNTLGQSQNSAINQAITATQWWPFLLMSLLVYGLLPRIITVILTRNLLQVKYKKSILSLHGTEMVLRRMNLPSIETLATDSEKEYVKKIPPPKRNITSLINQPAHLFHWGSPITDLLEIEKWVIEMTGLNSKGIFNAIEDAERRFARDNDKDSYQPIAQDVQTIVVIVKAWEPPTLELTDWLNQLRHDFQEELIIAVLTYDIEGENKLIPANEEQQGIWQDFLFANDKHQAEFHTLSS